MIFQNYCSAVLQMFEILLNQFDRQASIEMWSRNPWHNELLEAEKTDKKNEQQNKSQINLLDKKGIFYKIF